MSQHETPTILKRILARKWQEIEERQVNFSISQLKKLAAQVEPRFVEAIVEQVKLGRPAVIAEIKKASPSKGVIRADFDPAGFAKSYEEAGATCLSVLTDEDFFQGHEEYLKAAKSVTDLPIIRKDFTVDSYQLYEAKAMGADCVLLIAAALSAEKMKELNQQANDLGLDVLIEVHNQVELESALELDNKLIGINNRDLHTFDVSLQTTIDLLAMIPSNRIVVTESGISTAADVQEMLDAGVLGFLIGETFMRHDNPGDGLRKLFQGGLELTY